MNTSRKILIGIFCTTGVLGVFACGAGSRVDSPQFGAPVAVESTPAPTLPPGAFLGDGTFLVGTEVQPGRYRAKVPADSYNCYWARLKGTEGTFNDIIANENTDRGGQALVTILKSDKAFKTSGCGIWERV